MLTSSCVGSQVQCVRWSSAHPSHLLSASFDGSAKIYDIRSPSTSALSFELGADAEDAQWDPFNENRFLVSTEKGIVHVFDSRKEGQRVAQWKASKKETTCISFNAEIRNLVATASTDAKIYLWDVSAIESDAPDSGRNGTAAPSASSGGGGGSNDDGTYASCAECVKRVDVGVGAVFAMGWSRNNAMVMAAGGAKGGVVVWDARQDAKVQQRYKTHPSLGIEDDNDEDTLANGDVQMDAL